AETAVRPHRARLPTEHLPRERERLQGGERAARAHDRSEEHTSELQYHRDLHSFPTRRSSDLLKRQYDLIVLDCPPSISLVSENVFKAANALLVPMIDRKSTRLNSSTTEIYTLSLHDALPIC